MKTILNGAWCVGWQVAGLVLLAGAPDTWHTLTGLCAFWLAWRRTLA